MLASTWEVINNFMGNPNTHTHIHTHKKEKTVTVASPTADMVNRLQQLLHDLVNTSNYSSTSIKPVITTPVVISNLGCTTNAQHKQVAMGLF